MCGMYVVCILTRPSALGCPAWSVMGKNQRQINSTPPIQPYLISWSVRTGQLCARAHDPHACKKGRGRSQTADAHPRERAAAGAQKCADLLRPIGASRIRSPQHFRTSPDGFGHDCRSEQGSMVPHGGGRFAAPWSCRAGAWLKLVAGAACSSISGRL